MKLIYLTKDNRSNLIYKEVIGKTMKKHKEKDTFYFTCNIMGASYRYHKKQKVILKVVNVLKNAYVVEVV